MRRAGASRTTALGAVLVVALVAVGAAYLLTEGPKGSASQTTVSETSLSGQTGSGPSGSGGTSTSEVTGSLSSSPRSSTSSAGGPSTSSSTPAAGISHVVIVLMENEGYGSVIGNASAPYETGLASRYAVAGDYLAVAHPSLPNYLALVGGSTFGVATDCLPSECSLPADVPTIASLLDAHHLEWKEYAESMPANCSQTISADGLYHPKHDPFVYFGSVTGNAGAGATSAYCDSHVVPLEQFYGDLQGGNLPSFSFVTPNMCDDAHSCPLSAGDRWLSTFVPRITGSASFSSTAIFIVYDEGPSSDAAGGGGRVPCILVSPLAKSGYVSDVPYDHYSLLATVEAIYSLGNLGQQDAGATPMLDLFATWPPAAP